MAPVKKYKSIRKSGKGPKKTIKKHFKKKLELIKVRQSETVVAQNASAQVLENPGPSYVTPKKEFKIIDLTVSREMRTDLANDQASTSNSQGDFKIVDLSKPPMDPSELLNTVYLHMLANLALEDSRAMSQPTASGSNQGEEKKEEVDTFPCDSNAKPVHFVNEVAIIPPDDQEQEPRRSSRIGALVTKRRRENFQMETRSMAEK